MTPAWPPVSILPGGLLKRFLEGLAIDKRSLGLFRILLGLLWLGDLCSRWTDAAALHSDAGVLPLSFARSLFPHTTVSTSWMWMGSPAFAQAFLLLSMIVAVFFILGVAQRWAGIVAWILCVSLQSRNEMALYGMDHMLRLLFFWSLFLPLDHRFSLAKKEEDSKHSHLSIWSAAFLLQVVYFYFFGAVLKTGAEWRSEGSALYYAFEYDQFARPLAKTLLQFPGLLKFSTFAVLVLEFLSPLFLLASRGKVRTAAVFLFLLFHVGIALTLNLGLIPYTNMVALVLFLPASFWRTTGDSPIFSKKKLVPGLLLAAYVLAWNLGTLGWGKASPISDQASVENIPAESPLKPALWQWPGFLLRLDQDWGFFAPYPYKSDGWWIFRGQTHEGQTIDAWSGKALSSGRPQNFFGYYGGPHWIAYLILSLDPENSAHSTLLLDYLCRRNELLEEISFEYQEERTPKPGSAPLMNHSIIAGQKCLR